MYVHLQELIVYGFESGYYSFLYYLFFNSTQYIEIYTSIDVKE